MSWLDREYLHRTRLGYRWSSVEIDKKIDGTEPTIYVRKKINDEDLTNKIFDKNLGYSHSDINVAAYIFNDNIVSTIDVVALIYPVKIKIGFNKWLMRSVGLP